MAQSYLSLEITALRLRFMLVDGDRRECKVLAFGEVPYVMNVNAAGELTQAIQGIMAGEGMKPKRLFVSMCGHENFIRQLVIPKMAAKDQDDVIRGEIEIFPGFSQRSFDHIYRVSPFSDEKNNAVFAAVESTLLRYVFTECQKVGLPFEHLEVAPLNLKELVPLLQADKDNQGFLVIDDNISYLMVAGAGTYRLIYQAGIGLEMLYPDQKGILSERNVSSLSGELQRALKSYLFQNREEKVSKIWLVWNRQNGADLIKAFSGQFEAPVEALSLDKLSMFKVEAAEPAANPMHSLLAVPLVIFLSRIKAQFPLDHFCRQLNVKEYAMRLLLTALVVVGLIGAVILYKSFEFYQKTVAVTLQTEGLENEIADLNNTNADLRREHEEYLRIREGLLTQANLVKTLNRVSWSEVLSLVAEEMPKNMRLTSFKFKESGEVGFIGESLEIETVAELIRRVDRSSILENGKFDFLREKSIEDEKLFTFGILANLKSNDDGLNKGKP